MKKYIIEFLGTFFLTLVVLITKEPFVIGALFAVLVYIGGDISGGHYNPSVSIASTIKGKLDLKTLPFYVLNQIGGALIAAIIYMVMLRDEVAFLPSETNNIIAVVLIEILFTFILAYTVLNVTATKKIESNQYFGIAIGLILVVGAATGSPFSGGILNPAITIGSGILGILTKQTTFIYIGIFLLSQLVGGLSAGGLYYYINKEEIQSEKLEEQAQEIKFSDLVTNDEMPITKKPRGSRVQAIIESLIGK